MQPTELKHHIVETYGITDSDFDRIHEEFLAFYGQTLEEYVRRRHLELQKAGKKNDEIYREIGAEAARRRFTVRDLSTRKIRRLIYG
jgi:hypothetical protein